MTMSRSASLMLVIVLLLGGCALRTTRDADPMPAWLVGCWVSADGRSLEVWTTEADDTLIGFSSMSAGNGVSFYELMSIRRDRRSGLVLTAYPSNQPSGSFPVEQSDEGLVVFFSEAHDYPQRIRYQLHGERLFADIARADGSDRRNFVKQRCP